MVLLNTIRDFNRRHPDSPISVLTTDVEHAIMLSIILTQAMLGLRRFGRNTIH